MRSKAPLILMEQMVMLLVFAWAAALCLQAFAKSEERSQWVANRDQAVLLAQSAAETVRRCGGDMAEAAALLEVPYSNGGGNPALEIYYNEDWTRCDATGYTFCLWAGPVNSGVPGLGKASVEVTDAISQTVLFELETAWQEADGNGH